jgi:hypothetical protein
MLTNSRGSDSFHWYNFDAFRYMYILYHRFQTTFSLSFLSSFLCCKFLFGSWGNKKCKNQKGCLFKCSRFSFFFKKIFFIYSRFLLFRDFFRKSKIVWKFFIWPNYFLTISACLRRVKLILSKFFPKIT